MADQVYIDIIAETKKATDNMDQLSRATDVAAKNVTELTSEVKESSVALNTADDKTKSLANSTDRYGNEADSAESKTGKFGSAVKSAIRNFTDFYHGVMAAVLVAKKLFSVLSDLVVSYGKQEAAERRIQSALLATGKAATISTDALKQLSSELQKVTTFGDEVTLEAIAMVQSLANLDEQGLMRVTPAIQDFAAAMGMDLVSAASILGRTLGGATNMLTRYGIEVDMAGTETEKLGQIIDQINRKFGGLAEAMGDTTLGKIERFKNMWGDLKEVGGAAIAEWLTPTLEILTLWGERMMGASKDADTLADSMENLAAATAVLQGGKESATIAFFRDIKAMTEDRSIEEGIRAITYAFNALTAEGKSFAQEWKAAASVFAMDVFENIDELSEGGELDEAMTQLVAMRNALRDVVKVPAADLAVLQEYINKIWAWKDAQEQVNTVVINGVRHVVDLSPPIDAVADSVNAMAEEWAWFAAMAGSDVSPVVDDLIYKFREWKIEMSETEKAKATSKAWSEAAVTTRDAWIDAFEAIGSAESIYADKQRDIAEQIAEAKKAYAEATTAGELIAASAQLSAYEDAYEDIAKKRKTLLGFQKLAALAEIAINTAVAITEAMKLPPGLNLLAAGAAALAGIAQAGVVTSQKIPEMAMGGIVQPRQGGTLVRVAEAGREEVIFPIDKLESFLRDRDSDIYRALLDSGISSMDSQYPVRVPAMANGGIVTQPTLALIGERAPEAVVPLGMMGGGGVTIHVHGSVVSEDQLRGLVMDTVGMMRRRY